MSLMSQSIPTGYISPRQPPGISSKHLPGGRDLTFESCPGAGNSTRTGILWKLKVKLQKNSMDQILQVKTKNKLIFDLFEVYVFSEWNFSWSVGQFFGSAITHTLQKSEKLPLACLYFKFSLGYGYPHILLYKRL